MEDDVEQAVQNDAERRQPRSDPNRKDGKCEERQGDRTVRQRPLDLAVLGSEHRVEDRDGYEDDRRRATLAGHVEDDERERDQRAR